MTYLSLKLLEYGPPEVSLRLIECQEENPNPEEADIDTAMKFGVNYPLGPFEWSKIIGPDKICILLNELEKKTGKSRYKTSPFLYKEAKKYLSL